MLKGIGKKLKFLRKNKNYTLNSLSEEINKKYKVNFSKSSISMWENGKREIDRKNASIYCDFFNVSLDWLFGLSNKYNTNPIIIDSSEIDTSILTTEQKSELETVLSMNSGLFMKKGMALSEEDEEKIRYIITNLFIKKIKELNKENK